MVFIERTMSEGGARAMIKYLTENLGYKVIGVQTFSRDAGDALDEMIAATKSTRDAGAALDEHAALDAAASRFLQAAAARLGWSARGFHRILKVARTIADLAGEETIGTAHVAEAVQYRRGLQTR